MRIRSFVSLAIIFTMTVSAGVVVGTAVALAVSIDLSLGKSADFAPEGDRDLSTDISPGDILRYTLEFENTGGVDANDVKITDIIDRDMIVDVDVDAPGGDYDPAIGIIYFDVGLLEAGESGNVKYDVEIKGREDFPPEGGEFPLVNTAEIFEDNTHLDEVTNEETVRVFAQPQKTYGANEWYLAEGSTGFDHRGSFETWVLLQNAGDEDADVEVTYMTAGGPQEGPNPVLKPDTRATINVADSVPDEWSVSTHVTSDQPIIAERAMYWNSADGVYRQCAHDSIGVVETSSEWFLAEGSTGSDSRGNFETWVLLQNPGDQPTSVQMTYMTPTGVVAGMTDTLEPNTRQTYNVGAYVPDEWSVSTDVSSDQPIIAERAMYWNSADGAYRQSAHDSIGAIQAGPEWFLAEGSTGFDQYGRFETWVLVQNPGTEPTDIQITYMTPDGAVDGPTDVLQPNTRQTYNVGADVPDEWSVSTHVTSDQPVIAERAMYWHSEPGQVPIGELGVYRQAAHDSIGVGTTGNTWFIAEGSTGSDEYGSFQTWVLVQNAGTEPATIQITYMTPDGAVDGPMDVLEPNTRQTFDVAAHVPDEWSVSSMVTSDQPIIAERAMYYNSADGTYRQAAHDSIGLDP